ncbi:hypothetical protein VCUG_02707, partial [Vavraia culicis subsp. floridensis]
ERGPTDNENTIKRDENSNNKGPCSNYNKNAYELSTYRSSTCEQVYKNFKGLEWTVPGIYPENSDRLHMKGVVVPFGGSNGAETRNVRSEDRFKKLIGLENVFDPERNDKNLNTYNEPLEKFVEERLLRNVQRGCDISEKTENGTDIMKSIFSGSRYRSLNRNTINNKHVMVIENREEDQMYIVKFLSALPVTITTDYLQADILIISEKSVDNYVLVKTFLENAKVVILTLDLFDEKRCYEYLRMGVKEVVVKPYCIDTLFALLEKYIEP